MKTKLGLLFGSLMIGSSVHAAPIYFTGDEIAELPVLSKVQVVIDMPGSMTPAQPTGHVNFEYSSCSERDFSAEVTKVGRATIVQIVDASNADCRAAAKVRQYSVQISSDMSLSAAVTVLNPVRVEQK